MTPKSTGRDLTPNYALVQCFFWMQFAAIMGFSSLFLLGRGLTNAEIGLTIAAAGLFSAILQPTVASYADRADSPSVKEILIVLTAILIACGVLMLFWQKPGLLNGIFYGGCIAILQLMTPLVNSLGMESINQKKKLNFGAARCVGSAAYAVAAYLLGVILDRSGVSVLPVSILAISAGFLAFLFLFPFQKSETHTAATAPAISPLAFFNRYRRFGILLIGCVLVYISHVLLNSFTFQIVESKGGGSQEMGVSMALAALLELPTMFFFSSMVKKVRCDTWLRISGVFFMLKTLGTLLAPSIPVFYLVQLFQMFGWAIICVASVYYVNSIMEAQDAIKGQAYMTMTYTLGSVIGALIGGQMIDRLGVNAMLLFATAAAFLGMLIILAAAERGRTPSV